MKIGFIGCGNMGGALAKAACAGAGPDAVYLANRTAAKAQTLSDELNCHAVDNAYIARTCDYIFLGVKPQMMADMLSDISPLLQARTDGFVLVSMAAGLSTQRVAMLAGGAFPVVRLMPNTPCALGAGMVQYCCRNVSQQALETLLAFMAPAGRFDLLPETLMDAASAVSGCGPAYAYLFIEALADGGVACGLPRAKAQEYAAQMLLGAARMALESGEHPGALKDAVCSPAGSTIRGVMALEDEGFRAAVQKAVVAAFEKSKDLGK